MQSEGLEMWQALTTEAQTAYKLQDLSFPLRICRTTGFRCEVDALKPVIDAVTDALCCRRPSIRYLVDGVGMRTSYLDEYNVSKYNV